MRDLTGFQRDFLYCIAALDAPTGAGVKQEFEKHVENDINHGRLYPNLDELADEELISKTSKNDRANICQLTESGIDLIRDRRQWENSQLADFDIELETAGTAD